MYEYNAEFYQYINEGSARSAVVVVPALLELLPCPIGSVLDVGCGAGAWLSVWKHHGCKVMGLDGGYVDTQSLLIDGGEFRAQDLRQAFDLQERFDIVQCLEVAEHLPESLSATLVASLCRHAGIVLFSAAAPGQGGENHVNEQPYAFWRDVFADNGFQMYDPLRRAVKDDRRVLPWYRYNTFIYVNSGNCADTHAALARYRVDLAERPADLSPYWYRARKAAIRLLPVPARTGLAIMKKHVSNLSRRSK